MLRKGLYVFLLSLICLSAYGQESNYKAIKSLENNEGIYTTHLNTVDSLRHLLEEQCKKQTSLYCNSDTIKLIQGKLLLSNALEYKKSDLDSAIAEVKKAVDIFEDLNNRKFILKGQLNLASLQSRNGNLHDAAGIYTRLLNKYNLPDSTIAYASLSRGNCYTRIGYQDSAAIDAFKAIEIYENNGNKVDLANSYRLVGIVNTKLGQYKEADNYLAQALKICQDQKLSKEEALINISIANNIFSSGDTLGCIPYYKEATQAFLRSDEMHGAYVCQFNISNAYYQMTKYDSAKVYIEQAAKYASNSGARGQYMLDYKHGTINIEMGQYESGIAQLKSAYETALELKSYTDARDMARYLDRGYTSIGDYRNALRYSRQYAGLKDSIINIESSNTINELKAKYETEKKELAIENLELVNSRQRQRLLGGGIALGLISLLSFFLFRLYSKVNTQKETISKALSEKDLLLREIHHRVKNNLQLVSSLLTLQGRSIDDVTAQRAIQEGKTRVRSMALIHQDLYNKENLTDIGVKEYVEKLSQELTSTYNIRPDKVQLHMDVDEIDLDVDTMIPLGLIINELVTNSLKYAFPEGRSGSMFISLKEHSAGLKLTVMDNGIGYNTDELKGSSFGSTLISALVEQLEGELQVKNDNGLSTTIKVPVKE